MSHHPLHFSGNAVLCQGTDNSLLISNLMDGIDEYSLPELNRVQTIRQQIVDNYPVQVAAVNGGAYVVCGGDKGVAQVFDKRTGKMVQYLDHKNGTKLFIWWKVSC